MRAAIAFALALAACGSHATTSSCEQVVKRSSECSSAAKGMRVGDDDVGTVCKDERRAASTAQLADCLKATDCAAFDACVAQKMGVGGGR